MEDQIRGGVIKLDGPVPVIGTGVCVVALLAWFAYKAYDGDAKGVALIAGALGAGVLLAVVTSIPAAKASCRSLYQNDPVSFNLHNCTVLITCVARGLPGQDPTCY